MRSRLMRLREVRYEIRLPTRVAGYGHGPGLWSDGALQAANSPLEKSLFYREQAKRDKTLPTPVAPSAPPKGDLDPVQVPNPALVDLDSTITIHITRTVVHTSRRRTNFQGSQGARGARGRLKQLLDTAVQTLESRKTAMTDYSATAPLSLEQLSKSKELQAFQSSRKRFGVQQQALMDGLMRLFPKNSPQGIALNNILNDDDSKRSGRQEACLGPYSRSSKQKSSRLRIDRRPSIPRPKQMDSSYGWRRFWNLQPREPSDKPSHLQHYDSLDQGKVERTNRTGP